MTTGPIQMVQRLVRNFKGLNAQTVSSPVDPHGAEQDKSNFEKKKRTFELKKCLK